MADSYNPMQANLGLMPGQTQSPADIAAKLSQQASSQLMDAQSRIPVAGGGGAAFSFGEQFQQQLGQIQAQQSMGVYQAAMMAGAMPGVHGYAGSMMPSPLTMTPPSTGVFRPPMASPSITPIAPMVHTPLGQQMPQPMFQTAWEQETQQREARADQLFSYQSQAPRALGQGAGYGLGALAGGMLGSRFGGAGRMIGAAAGAGLAHVSGMAQGMGSAAMAPMQPMIQAHTMGASLQRASQDWVVGGPNLHAMGRGLTRDASQQLATGIQDMASDPGFKSSTGGMFNQQDLMKITQLSGQTGLMDMEQSIPGIQQNLRRVSQAIGRFMELTNQPDVVSVVRQMGQLRQLGFDVDQMDEAASSMRSFSRMAGTSVQSMQQQYGMSGAMTYQQAGLLPASGMQYGMYSGAMAQQGVSSGVYNTQQLAMLGGTGGIAQRNTQAQAAMMSTSMFGAAAGQFGGGGWGMNAGSLAQMSGGGGGAQGMALNAMQNMGAAVQGGGVGALALFPLQQRQIQAQAANAMSPYEQTTMRFQMAKQTGEGLGLKGAGAFAVGAQAMFGQEVAEQMMIEASDPTFWTNQREAIERRQGEIAREQREQIREAAPNMFESAISKGLPSSGTMRQIKDTMVEPFARFGSEIEKGYDNLSNWKRKNDAWSEGRTFTATPKEFIASSKGDKRAQRNWEASANLSQLTTSGAVGSMATDPVQAFRDVSAMQEAGGGPSARSRDMVVEIMGTSLDYLTPVGIASAIGGYDTSDLIRSVIPSIGNAAYGDEFSGSAARFASKAQKGTREVFRQSKRASRTGEAAGDVYSEVEKAFGLDAGMGFQTVSGAGSRVAGAAERGSSIIGGAFNKDITQDTVRRAAIVELAEASGISVEEAITKYDSLPQSVRKQYEAMSLGSASQSGSAEAKEALASAGDKALGSEARRQNAYSESGIEKTMGRMRNFEGAMGIPSGGQTDEFRSFTKSASKSEIMMSVLESGANLSGDQKKAYLMRARSEFARENDFKDPNSKEAMNAFHAAQTKVASGFIGGKEVFDTDMRDRFKAILGQDSMDDGMQGAALLLAHSDLQRSGIHQKAGQAALSKIINPALGGGVTDFDSLMGLGDKELLKLKKKGLGTLAKQIATARGGDEGAIAGVHRTLGGLGAGMVSEEEETQTREAEGKEARLLERGREAVIGGQAAFGGLFKRVFGGKEGGSGNNFNEESTKNFKEGASLLYDAALKMQTNHLRKP